MITATLNMKKFINLYNAKEVYNHSVEGPGSVTDPEIFGYGEDRKRKFGYIKLNGHFIDPTLYTMVSRRVYRDLPLIVSGDKKYIIGKNGEMLKKISTYAREDLEKMLNTKLNLKVWVKVKEDWMNKDFIVNKFKM